MISYEPLWRTMKEKGITTYHLRAEDCLGGGTVDRLKKNLSVSTTTLDMLCQILGCSLVDVVEYIEEDK